MKSALRLLLCIIFASGGIPRSGAQIITTIAGNGVAGYGGDGNAATLASLNAPASLTLDNAGNLYIDDEWNFRVRRVNLLTGIITTYAGNGYPGFNGDNIPATNAELNFSWGVAADGLGNVYITDQESYRIRKVNSSGIINTIAGNGDSLDSGDGGLATNAAIGTPIGIALDGSGNLYFCDQTAHVIREVNTSGVINRVAGSGGVGYSGDGGPALAATFRSVFGLCVDAGGNLYICDAQNNCIRKVNTAGIISTIAGTGTPGYNGDNIPATNAYLNQPSGVYADGKGNIYICDSYNNRIRKVNASGIITTIAGAGTAGFSGDNGMATAAQLDTPADITMDNFGNIYVTDFNNQRIRVIFHDLAFNLGAFVNVVACQNFSGYSTPLDSQLAVRDISTGLTITWSIADSPTHGTAYVSYSNTSGGGTIVPSGLYYTPDLAYTGNDTFTVRITDGFDTDSITVYVSVVPLPSYGGVIDGPSYVCVGSSITLYDTTGEGTWSITNLDAIVANGVVTGESPGADTVNYTISNSCGAVTVYKAITIFPLPDAGTISGAPAICIGSTSAYTDDVSGGNWTSHNPHAAISATGIDSAFTAGRDTIFYTVSDGLCQNTASLIVAIDSFPFARLYPQDTMVCAGATVTMADTPAGGNWALSNGNATVSQGTVTTVSPGMDTVLYSVTNACGTATTSAHIVIDSLPPTPVIIQNGSQLSAPPDYSAYQWMLNGAPILGSTVDTYLVANTGQYSVFVKNKYGCSAVSPPVYVAGCTPDEIVIYPNPVESSISIKWCKIVTIRIICEDGKTYDIANGTNQADLSGLPNGEYIIVLYDLQGNKIKAEKISKVAK